MNAVIVDLQGEYAAALCENGTIEKIPDNGYEIGQKISLPSTAAVPAVGTEDNIIPIRSGRKTGAPRAIKRISALAAALILVVSLGAGMAYAMPYGTVSLDSDASIEYTINCFDYVIDVSANNEEGEAVLNSMDSSLLFNRRIDNAVAATMEQTEADGYCDSESDVVLSVGTRGGDHSEQLAERLGGVVDCASVIPVTMEDIETAHENGMTAGQNWLRNQPEPSAEADVTAGGEVPSEEPGSQPADAGIPDGSNGEGRMDGQSVPDNAGSNGPGGPDGTDLSGNMDHTSAPENPDPPENGMNPANVTADGSPF